MSKYQIAGKRVPRVDAIPKATGAAIYTNDIRVAGMIYGKVLRSPHAHARIKRIDTSKALRLPGVKAVITAQDFEAFRYGFVANTRDEAPLAIDKVRFIGDEVAAVAANDEEIAEEALGLIEVEYEPLPAVFDPEGALLDGAPQIHDQVLNNVSARINMDFGDVNGGFAQAYHVREDRFYSQSVLHGFLEPHSCVAQWDPSGGITIWASKQSPYFLYRNLASCFRLPLSKVRVIQPNIGGGFGGKNESFALDFCAVMLSKKTGRPVKITYVAEDILGAGRRRHPFIINLKTGVTKDGLLLASEMHVVADGGAYASVGPFTLYLAGAFVSLPYSLPAYRYIARRAYTNKPVCNAMRGHGIPQVRFAADCQLELIANDLGIDPVEIRRRNAVKPGHVTPNNMHVTTCGLSQSIDEAIKAMDWDNRKRELADERKSHPRILRGVGIASNAFCSGARMHGHTACSAVVKVHEDGTVSLLTGSTDSGQGSETVLAIIVAEYFGIPVEMVSVSRVDTLLTPIDPGSYGSRVTSTAGNAAKLAALDARKKLAEVASELLKCAQDDLVFREGEVYDRNHPEKKVSFRNLCRATYTHGYGQVIVGHGHWGQEIDLPNWETGEGDIADTYSFGTQAAEVEVDQQTGRVKVTKMVVAHDLGFAINPLSAEGQHEGCVFAGIGHALYEECQVEEGRTLNTSFLEYKMPTPMDMPRVIESIGIETCDGTGVFGSKESAEGTQVSTVPAIVNAIYDATGVMFTELPITPEKVVKALREKERQDKEGR